MSTYSPDRNRIVFLFPLVYRPNKDNFGREFELLSRWYEGHIFALSGGRLRNLPLGRFLFHSEKYETGSIRRLIRGIFIQLLFPLRFMVRKPRVAAVVAYDPFRSGVAAVVLKLALRCKAVVELNGDYHVDYGVKEKDVDVHRVRHFFLKSVFKFTLRRADAIKVLNAEQEAFCHSRFPKKAIYRFPAFVATEYFGSLQSYQGDYLLSIGHPFDLKGMDVLIAAFRRLSEKHRRFQLRIMGYCTQGEIERYRVLAAGEPRVSFVRPGWIEQVGEEIRGCFALVNAARSEAMGRVHVEAMACGKPVVATRTNGGMECVEDGRTGLLCAVGDVEDLAEKLDELLSDPIRADSMGKAGRERMVRMFSEERCIEARHQMFKDVFGASADSGA